MRLIDVELDPAPAPLPAEVKALLDDADLRIERFQHEHRNRPFAAFVPCDFVLVHQALMRVDALSLAAGRRFIEWGSGAGVVTCLASRLGWDAIGVEIEAPLVDLAEAIAEDHGMQAEFVQGSFVPADADVEGYDQRDINWLQTDGPDAYEELGLDPDDFDLVFAYPWPGEEEVVFDVFADAAAVGALLLTYHGQDGVRLQRKVH